MNLVNLAAQRVKSFRLLTPFIFFLFAIFFLLLGKTVAAQIPQNPVDCDDTTDSEFHSLRPYQASPCKKEPSDLARFCGNRLVLTDSVSAPQTIAPSLDPNCERIDGNRYRCSYNTSKTTTYKIDLSQAKIPVLGNTENVINSQNQNDELDDAEKTNEYVSWYLNGVTGRAEYPYFDPENPEDVSKIVNFSGPLKKLLPWDIQASLRIESVKRAGEDRHNQVVACTSGSKAVPCYEGDPTQRRLSDWEGTIAPGFLTADTTWNKRIPPLRGDFEDLTEYQKAYLEWRGKSCKIIQIPFTKIKTLLCIDNPLRPNYWANLFPYIPFSSTEDRVGQVSVDSQNVREASDDLIISNVSLVTTPAELYFAHTEENSELAEQLQMTFVPQGLSTEGSPSLVSPTEDCDLTNIRSNEGDNLFAGTIEGNLSYNAEFSCEFSGDASPSACKKNISVGLGVVTQTPKADELWSRLVAGPAGIFKRIFPKVGEGGAIVGILDIPAATKVTYSGSGLVSAGNPEGRAGESAELYFPHLGGISEYFLKGIQTILRPKGFGEQILSGQASKAVSCGGGIPQLPSADSSCTGGCNFKFPSPTMEKIFKSAASFYKVPLSVLVGIFYNEGGFERYKWNEELVKTASGPNCEVPNCSSFNVSATGAKGPWQFIGWGNQAIDAVNGAVNDGRTPNPCNLLDSTFAAAAKLARQKAGWGGYQYPTCVGVKLNTGASSAGNSCNWSDSDVVTAARQYLGYCESPNPLERTSGYPIRTQCSSNINGCYQKSVLNIFKSSCGGF